MKAVIALLLGLLLIGSVLAGATSLNVGGGTIQAGYDDDLVCDEDGVYVADWELDPITGLVDSVRIGGIDDCCQNCNVDLCVVLTRGGFKLVEGWYDNVDASEVSVPLDYPMAAYLITDIEVFLVTGGKE